MNLDIASAFCKSLFPRFVYSSIARASVPEALDYEMKSLTEMFTSSLLLVCKTTHSRKPSNMREGSVLEIINLGLIHLGITNLTLESRIHNSSPQMLRGGALSLEAGATWTEAREGSVLDPSRETRCREYGGNVRFWWSLDLRICGIEYWRMPSDCFISSSRS